MFRYALKMLINDRAKYVGIVTGLSFASFIIVQQASIFVGLMLRTIGFIYDTPQPDVWVMDDKVQFIDDTKPMSDTRLYRVRGIDGVAWAVPLYKGILKARLNSGNYQNCNLIGVDSATLIGAPPIMLEGDIISLRDPDAIIVDTVGANDKLSLDFPVRSQPLVNGDVIEINDKRAKVVGICKAARTFQSQPTVYTTYNRALNYAPNERKLLSFILVKAKEGISPKDLARSITNMTGLKAFDREDFRWLTISYYLKYTGIPINFGISVLLGFIIGTAIAGQTFYNFTLDNLRYFATFRAMGAPMTMLRKMILLQSFWVGGIGWGIGTGAASIFGFVSKNSELSFVLTWWLFLASMTAVGLISALSSFLSLKKIEKMDASIVFKS
ncbi:MAG: FtsX-like permease family protein [Chlamydiae bacterium]|nr:FtsX-like permease family protein [Chlamydiota bacterium]